MMENEDKHKHFLKAVIRIILFGAQSLCLDYPRYAWEDSGCWHG